MKKSSMLILGLALVAASPGATPLSSIGLQPALFSLALVTPAAAAQDVVFENLSFTPAFGKVTIPRIEVNGSSLGKDDLQGLVAGPWSPATAGKLAQLDATSIVIPELRIDVAIPGPDGKSMTQNAVYRALRMDDIKAGRAARVSADGFSATAKADAAGDISITAGAYRADGYDMAGAMRFAFGTGSASEPQKVLVGAASFDGFRMSGPQGVSMSVGKVTVGPIKARPLAVPLTEVLALASRPDKANLTPADLAKMMRFAADMYDAFSVDDGMVMNDLNVKGPANGDFQGVALKSVKIGPIAHARFAEFGIEGLDVTAKSGHAKLGRFALLGLDIKPFLTTMSKLADQGEIGPQSFARLDWRSLVPTLDGLLVKDVDFDIPNGSNRSQRLQMKLGSYELSLGNYISAIPTAIRLAVDNLFISSAAMGPQARQLQQLGYPSVSISVLDDIRWDEAAKAINVAELSAKGADMGSVLVKGVIGNVPRELFAGEMPQMQVAALGATLRNLSLRVENGGLFDRVVAMEAKRRDLTPDKIRAEWGSQAALGIPALLGSSDQAKALGNAVASFIAKPKSLAITVKAREAAGFGITDVMGGDDPPTIFGKLDITATANE